MASQSLINVFTPAEEVQDIERFAGREEQLRGLCRALQSEGVQIVIYGNRGIGKSSLARQLEAMSFGDEEVLEKLDGPPEESFDFLTIFFRCDDSIEDLDHLLLRLLSDDDALASWVPFKVVERQSEAGAEGGVDVRLFQLKGSETSSITEATEKLDTDVVSVFKNTLTHIVESGIARDGVLIILDEFDRIQDQSRLASLVRTLGPKGVRFALVGVATTVQDLIADHESISRQLAGGTVLVPPMSREEIEEIFERAEKTLGGSYEFSEDARDWIAKISRGHPFYVHLVGKHALLKTADAGEQTVTKDRAEQAMKQIALKGSAPSQEATYKTAIGHSFTREYVLKTLAQREEDEIHTREVYSQLGEELGLESKEVSVYVGQLTSDKYGEVLEKTRERYYRFRDSLFKAYAAARPFQLSRDEDGEAPAAEQGDLDFPAAGTA